MRHSRRDEWQWKCRESLESSSTRIHQRLHNRDQHRFQRRQDDSACSLGKLLVAKSTSCAALNCITSFGLWHSNYISTTFFLLIRKAEWSHKSQRMNRFLKTLSVNKWFALFRIRVYGPARKQTKLISYRFANIETFDLKKVWCRQCSQWIRERETHWDIASNWESLYASNEINCRAIPQPLIRIRWFTSMPFVFN